jgi:hypothetical protein
MKRLVKFELENGGVVVAEVDDQEPGFERAARGDRDKVIEAPEKFQAALDKVRPAAAVVIEQFKDLTPSEIMVEFGIRLNFKAGAVLASSEGEAHFKVALTWTSG